MTNRTLRTQRIAKPALRLQSSDLFLTRQGTDSEDSVALMSDLTTFNGPHPRYHFHGYAGDQIVGDGKFFDRTALGNHGVRGANLSDAQMFANAGYVTTIDPAGGATDSVIRLPNLNFYHLGGEKLILFWKGKATPEGTDQAFIADGGSATYPGFRMICKSSGSLQVALYDSLGGSNFTGTTSATPFDGTLRSVGMMIDGTAKKWCAWVDGTIDAMFSGVYGNFALGGTDTRNANTVNIGQGAPASAASTNGMATQTRALHILRLSAADTMPPVATMSAIMAQLHANPSKPILGSAF